MSAHRSGLAASAPDGGTAQQVASAANRDDLQRLVVVAMVVVMCGLAAVGAGQCLCLWNLSASHGVVDQGDRSTGTGSGPPYEHPQAIAAEFVMWKQMSKAAQLAMRSHGLGLRRFVGNLVNRLGVRDAVRNAPQGGLDAIRDPWRQDRRPAGDGLRCDAYGQRCRCVGPAQETDRFCFVHGNY